jgi:hypothetical protein
VTPEGQQALAAAWQQPELDTAFFVFSSRHGEFSRTLSILTALARQEPLSPADFSLSVHHSLLALLSQVKKNTNGHTALAAGEQSFEAGLCEALAILAENPDHPVLLVSYDAPLPGAYEALDATPPKNEVLALLLNGPSEGLDTYDFVPMADREGGISSNSDLLSLLNGDEASCVLRLGREPWLLTRERHA